MRNVKPLEPRDVRRPRMFTASEREHNRYRAAAQKRNISLSEFIRFLLDREIGQVDGAFGKENDK